MNDSPKLSRRHRRCNRTGATLFELVMVLGIISIMAVVATLTFNSSHRKAKLQHAADRLIADLRLVSNQARRDQKNYELVIDKPNRRYRATSVTNLKGTGDIIVDLSTSQYDVSSITMFFNGISKVKFDAKGHVQPHGSIVLKARNKKIVIYVNEIGVVKQRN